MTQRTPERLYELAEEMKEIPSHGEYYALTLTADEDGKIGWSVQSCFAGWTEGTPRRELREAALVYPDKMARLWSEVGEGWLAVSSSEHVPIFLAAGGNALVEKSIAERWFKKQIRPIPVAAVGLLGGFRPLSTISEEVLRRAPSRKLRMRVLNRDSRRCKICGRSPDDHVDVELHVHHVLPWGSSGLTEEANLVTLCHTCHGGLDPHFDPTLFKYTGGLALPLDDDHSAAVARYRELVQAVTRSERTHGSTTDEGD